MKKSKIRQFRGTIIDPGFIVKEKGGIIIPSQLQAPYKIGRVLASDGELKQGDFVVYHMEKATDINWFTRRPIYIDDKLHIITDEAFIQGKIISGLEELKLQWEQGVGIPVLDYEGGQVMALGTKVFVQIEDPKEMTESGIHIPAAKIGKDVTIGTILAMGDTATKDFRNPDELQVGDRVRLPKRPSGVHMALTGKGKKVYRTNAEEVIMKWVEMEEHDNGGYWRPVGGHLLIAPYFHGLKTRYEDHVDFMTGSKTTQKVYYNEEKPEIVYPITTDLAPLVSTIILAGDGIKPSHSFYKHIPETVKFHPGMRVGHAKLTNDPGQPSKYRPPIVEVVVKEGDEPLLVMPGYLVDQIIKGHKIGHFLPGKAEPVWTLDEIGIDV